MAKQTALTTEDGPRRSGWRWAVSAAIGLGEIAARLAPLQPNNNTYSRRGLAPACR
jgi:hypothetical protein